MKLCKTMLATVLLASFGIASAGIAGGSSNQAHVRDGESDIMPFGSGDPGLSLSNDGNAFSFYVNLENGPVTKINRKFGGTPINGHNNWYGNADGTRNPQHLRAADVFLPLSLFVREPLGQVWYEKRHNNTEVYSVRQMAELSSSGIAAKIPKFGGLVIAKVPGMPREGNVFFGEWAPRKNGTAPDNSTDLNMGSSQRTVWYVGENPTQNMPRLVNARYNVLGVNQHTPGRNDFYTGVLTANYGAGKNELSGSISRPGDSVNFADTKIQSDGTFNNGRYAADKITGRFYGNGAEALAGIVDRAGVDKDVAFGGRKQ
ncbi:hypothetical protein HMPREF3107_06680 [Neisseria sp. HMSC31F04]|uniref:Slam-dependent surface lipoprotein n=1 Tax=Neisseria sp. HMSC31F04 TaxID=1581075 RepID=UPI0008A292D1|nr:Slam-dependent surface lipoprotein [Neisseria sp. HMSC31F04]OFT01186.1 hypothetical protein HMPREF3107_06680 [Neisseria sp. HMSC31F04]